MGVMLRQYSSGLRCNIMDKLQTNRRAGLNISIYISCPTHPTLVGNFLVQCRTLTKRRRRVQVSYYRLADRAVSCTIVYVECTRFTAINR